MTISDEDLDELRLSLEKAGFREPYEANIQDYPGPKEHGVAFLMAERMNREALRNALERTRAWHRYRIY